MTEANSEAVTGQPAKTEGRPPPRGAPPGGEWETEPFCGARSWLVGIFCWCVICCPIDKKMALVASRDGPLLAAAHRVDGALLVRVAAAALGGALLLAAAHHDDGPLLLVLVAAHGAPS
ncbi:unnamed protein product, partial [Pylaiella littoralis]